MQLFILRHGHAEPQVTTDQARNLTSTGRGVTQAVVRAALPQLNNLQQIWASPLVRAQQTAHLALHFLPQLHLQTTDCLVPEANPAIVYDWLESLRQTAELDNKTASIMIVSHQPLVGNLVNQLCGKTPEYYPMDTSTLAAIELDVVAPGMGKLLWLHHG